VCEKKKGGKGAIQRLPCHSIVVRASIRGRGAGGGGQRLEGGKGVWAKGVGPRTRGDHRTLHIHCIFFSKLPKEASIEAVADARSTQASAQLTSIKDDVKALRKHEGGPVPENSSPLR